MRTSCGPRTAGRAGRGVRGGGLTAQRAGQFEHQHGLHALQFRQGLRRHVGCGGRELDGDRGLVVAAPRALQVTSRLDQVFHDLLQLFLVLLAGGRVAFLGEGVLIAGGVIGGDQHGGRLRADAGAPTTFLC
jgi:hypothetical protein